MDLEVVYLYADKRIGSYGRDYVHDLICVIPRHKLTTSYLIKCVNNYRKPRLIEIPDAVEAGSIDATLLAEATAQVRAFYEKETDIFLACVDSSQNAFSNKSGISRPEIKKICTFVKNEIKTRYEWLDNF